MQINKCTANHIKALGKLGTPEQAHKYLKDLGLKEIGQGCESKVFARAGSDVVVKVSSWQFGNSGTREEHSHLMKKKEFVDTKVFRFPDNDSFIIIVQKRVDSVIEDVECEQPHHPILDKFRDFVTNMRIKYKVKDLHSGNVGLIDGELVIFDWNIIN